MSMLLDTLLALGLTAVISTGVAHIAVEKAEEMKEANVAGVLTMATKGFESYIANNRQNIDAVLQANGNTPIPIDPAALEQAGYLPSGSTTATRWHHFESPNGYFIELVVGRHPTSNAFVAYVICAPSPDNGRPMNGLALRNIAAMIGPKGAGGYTDLSSGTPVFHGIYGSWEIQSAAYAAAGLNTSPGYPIVSVLYGSPFSAPIGS